MLSDRDLDIVRRAEVCRFKRLVAFHEDVYHIERNHSLSPCTRHIRVHHGDDSLGTFDGSQGRVYGCSERYISVLVRRTYLDHRHIAAQGSAAVQLLGFAEEDRNIVCVAGLDALADIGSDKECLMEEDSVILRICVWRWTLGMQMMYADILKFTPVTSGAKSFNQHPWGTCHAAEMHMVARLDDLDSLLGRNEFYFFGHDHVIILSKIVIFLRFANFVPIMHTLQEKQQAFARIIEVLDELREKCPWDRKQTNESLRPQTIEEVYELSDAILKGEERELSKELGDVLLHVLFYAKIGEEKQHFDIVDVINFLCDKLIYRHPHVFSTAQVGDAEDVIKQWEMLKTTEKDGNKRVLSGVPDGLPPLLKAYRMQDKARGVGFDWECKEQVWDKVKEEMEEYQAELDAMAAAQSDEERKAAYDRAEEELGDFLFATVNAARLYGLNPDTALERTCAKFRRRFTYLEEQTIRKGRNLKDMTLAEMDAIWDEGKAKGL